MWNLSVGGVDIIFRNPEYFVLSSACSVFLVVILFLWEMRSRKKVQNNPWIKEHLAGSRIPSRNFLVTECGAIIIAVVLLSLALAQPERKTIDEEPLFGNVRFTFLVDNSKSMYYGRDVRPQQSVFEPNRMGAAKEVISDFTTALWSDPELMGRYKIALIPFRGAAQPFYLTFTSSRSEFETHLSLLNERVVTKGGTSFLAVFRAYHMLLTRYPPLNPDTVDIAILVSDGGKEEGIESEGPYIQDIIAELRGFLSPPIIYTVGIGSIEITPDGRRITRAVKLIESDEEGSIKWYREDPENPGSPVLTSQLDEKMLITIAREWGGGEYYYFLDRDQLVADLGSIILSHRTVVDYHAVPRYEPLFMWFVIPAFVILYIVFGYHRWFQALVYSTFCVFKRLLKT